MLFKKTSYILKNKNKNSVLLQALIRTIQK